MIAKEKPRVLVAGGGVAGLEVLLGLAGMGRGVIALGLVGRGGHFTCMPPFASAPTDHFAAPAVFELAPVIAAAAPERIDDTIERVEPAGNVVHTKCGKRLTYDVLVIATGASTHESVAGAICLSGASEARRFTRLLSDLEAGAVTEVAFVVPTGVVWQLPLYELALTTASWCRNRRLPVRISLVSPESAPLRHFGRTSSRRVTELLRRNRVALKTSSHAVSFEQGSLRLASGASLPAQAVVAAPRLAGPAIAGLPTDSAGFLRTDGDGLVEGMSNVYAAGDCTSFPVRQSSIAAGQAGAVVAAIAARSGLAFAHEPFRPVLRGLSVNADSAPWIEPQVAGVIDRPAARGRGVVVGRHLARRLSDLGLIEDPEPAARRAAAG